MATRRPSEMGQVRIIGGQWRSRRLSFPAEEGLRPTTDRVRETLFNWLAPQLPGARVLDAFAGSGALLLEALSRGAGEGLAWELNPKAVAALRQNLQLLQCSQALVEPIDTLGALGQKASAGFDIVFLDPPFNRQLLAPAAALLEQQGWLNPAAWIYTESEHPPASLAVPTGWRLHRDKRAGQAHYALWQRQET